MQRESLIISRPPNPQSERTVWYQLTSTRQQISQRGKNRFSINWCNRTSEFHFASISQCQIIFNLKETFVKIN